MAPKSTLRRMPSHGFPARVLGGASPLPKEDMRMLAVVESALWIALPWEACLAGAVLLGWMLPTVIGDCDRAQRGVAFMVSGALVGVGAPLVFALADTWTFPLFILGCWLTARGAFGLSGDRWSPASGLWRRMSQGVWCLGVSCALMYGASHYSSLQPLTGVMQSVAGVFVGGAALFFALALAAYLSAERAAPWAAHNAPHPHTPHDTSIYPAEYPPDFPTLPSTMPPTSSHGSRISATAPLALPPDPATRTGDWHTPATHHLPPLSSLPPRRREYAPAGGSRHSRSARYHRGMEWRRRTG
jgi:hypothetical protein